MARGVEHRLKVAAQGGELGRTDVERVVRALWAQRAREHDGGAEIFDVEQLVAVVAGPRYREVAALVRPLEEQREGAEALGPDERLRPHDGHDPAALALGFA